MVNIAKFYKLNFGENVENSLQLPITSHIFDGVVYISLTTIVFKETLNYFFFKVTFICFKMGDYFDLMIE